METPRKKGLPVNEKLEHKANEFWRRISLRKRFSQY